MLTQPHFRVIGLLMVSILALVVLTACSSDADDDGTAAAPVSPTQAAAAPRATAAPTQAPVVVEPAVTRVVISHQPVTESNNPGRDSGVVAGFQTKPIHESLIGYDANTGALVPQLATSWSLEPDGISLRFKLREGVRFHGDLGEFTARDVVYSHTQITAEDSSHSHKRQYGRATVEVVNDHEVIFALSAPNGEFLWIVSELNPTSLDIQSAADFDILGAPDLTTRPLAGTGFYQFQERAVGQYMRLERVPYDHWRANAEFPELEFRWQSEASTRLAALLTEEVHLTQLPVDLKPQAISGGMSSVLGQQFGQRAFVIFTGVYGDADYRTYKKQNTPCGFVHCDSPFLDVRVRRALSKAINRDELNDGLFGGDGQTMFMNHMFPNNPLFNPDWERNFPEEYGYDPAAATTLLAEAGYNSSNPLEVNIDFNRGRPLPQAADVLEVIGGYWRDVGVKANFLDLDPAALNPAVAGLKYKDHVQLREAPNNPLQSWRVWNSNLVPRGNGIELPEINTLVGNLLKTMDVDVQNQMLRELGDITYSLHMTIPLYWVPPEVLFNPKVISSYNFPGNTPGAYWSHTELIKAAR